MGVDATGTLTAGRVLAERVWTPFGTYHVGGSPYEPAGAIVGDADPSDDPFLPRLARVAAAGNDATLVAPRCLGEPWAVIGDPTDGALLALAARIGISSRDLRERHPLLARFTEEPAQRWVSTLHRDRDQIWVAVKGVPDVLVALGHPDEPHIWQRAQETAERWGADGYRIIALTERSLDSFPDAIAAAVADLTILGLVGLADPPRPGQLQRSRPPVSRASGP